MAGDDDTVYVAVGEVEESELTLLWTLHSLSPQKVCILHVHQRSKVISSIAGNLEEFMFGERELAGLEEVGNEMMHRIMDDYLLLCRQAEVRAEKLYIHRDDVGKGIVELIQRYNIKKLVMGAAADKHFSERMWLRSEKAQYVNENAPLSCQIWFICRDYLVHTRLETGQSSNAPSPSGSGYLTSSSEAAVNLASTVFEEREESESGLDPFVLIHSEEDPDSLSMPNESSSNEQLYDQLEQALQEAESSNRKAFEESERRIKVERDAVRAMRQAKEFERLNNELKRETELALAKQKEDVEKMKREKLLLEGEVANSNDKITELEVKLSSALQQSQVSRKERDELQEELGNTRKVTEELLRKQAEESSSRHMQQSCPDQLSVSEIRATLDQLHICQKEKDDLQVELVNTRMMFEELLRKQPLTEYSVSEIHDATEDFDPLYKIAEGTQGNVYYKCVLRHTEVAIKVLGQNRLQDPSKFQREVDDLIQWRHPNLVTLIGACPEIWALVFEYLPNGSLEDRLSCRNDTPPLPWQTRMCIATELCSTLMFLHSSKSQSIVHGNLKPGNILLDLNFGCKLGDYGGCRALALLENSSNMTESSNTYPYLDPDFRNTGRLSKSLDLYPFGIILLQLLSGRSTEGIAESAQNALLNGGNLNSFLDSSAGNCPYQVAQLTHLAIRCCDINPSRRPDLASEVLEVLKTMRPSSAVPLSYPAESNEDSAEPPSYFVCPIMQVVMTDPHVAADGYTYEATALQEWLVDHDTSPMSNLRLPHSNLIPNHPLRSAIQQWQENH